MRRGIASASSIVDTNSPHARSAICFLKVGTVARALAWHLALAKVDEIGEYTDVLPSLFREFLEVASG